MNRPPKPFLMFRDGQRVTGDPQLPCDTEPEEMMVQQCSCKNQQFYLMDNKTVRCGSCDKQVKGMSWAMDKVSE